MVLFHKLCDYGERVATTFSDLCESIYDLPWHLCSTDLQLYIVFMVKVAQIPVYLHGFHMDCSLEMFKKVSLLHACGYDFIDNSDDCFIF